MKKLATLVFALLLAGSLSFAQAAGTAAAPAAQTKSDTKAPEEGKKAHKGSKKSHKGGKKSKKGATETTATQPK